MKLPKIKNIKKIPKQRLIAIVGVQILFFSIFAGLPLNNWLSASRYKLSGETLKVIGSAKPELANKLAFNGKEGLYQFNPEAKISDSDNPEDVARRLQQNVTGNAKDKGLYSLDLSLDSKKGMTIYDNNSRLSFKLIPKFNQAQGRKVQDRVVYPMQGKAKAIYTVKSNGIKEDIVFEQSPKSGEVSFGYDLVLPDSLEARLQKDGSLGVFSADPSLFGDISFGADEDREKVESARKNAQKTNLVFGVPRPVIVAANGNVGDSYAWFQIENNVLSVNAKGLQSIQGAFSIDPSVVVTSSSDFQTGNDEFNINFNNPDQISRNGLSGGALSGTWSSVNSLPAALDQAGTVVSNGYIYVIGGYNGTVNLKTVYYAQIQTNGTIGAWASALDLPQTVTRMGAASYNGYVYSVGGYNGTATIPNVYVAKSGSAGVLTAWSSLTSLPNMTQSLMVTAYKGYLYAINGNSGSAGYTAVYYAAINSDGTIGSWLTTSSTPVTNSNASAVAYNDYIYYVGGYNGSAVVATVAYVHVNVDGSLGAWGTTTSLPTVLESVSIGIYDGYIYEMAGDAGSAGNANVRYAQINSDGTLGSWNATTSLPVAHTFTSSVMYNGYFYKIGGITPSFVATVLVNNVMPMGATSSFTETSALPTQTSKGQTYGRDSHTSVAYNGFLYVLGGFGATAPLNDVQYASVNLNGTISAWTATTPFTTGRDGHTTVIANGYIYVMGGYGATARVADVQYALICTANNNGVGGCTGVVGTVGTWTATTPLPSIRGSHTSIAYNGYVYSMGGTNGTSRLANVDYALICTGINSGVGGCTATAGTLGTWVATTSLPTAREQHASVAVAGYVYVTGGFNGTTTFSDVQYALICTGTNSGVGGCTATAGTLGTWVPATSLPATRTNHTAVEYNGFIYVMGGLVDGTAGTTGLYSDIQYAPINSDGSLGAWTATTSMPITNNGHASVVYNGFLYVSGGDDPSVTPKVRFARLGTGGSGNPSVWTSAGTTIATNRTNHTSAVYDGYLYVLGGVQSGSTVASVQSAPLSEIGVVGSWSAINGLPITRQDHATVISNGYIYVIGGSGTTGASNVIYALLCKSSNNGVGGCTGAAGTVGTWTYGSTLPDNRYSVAASVSNGYIYTIGGYSTTQLSDVLYTTVNANGGLGSWTATTSLPIARSGAVSFVANGYLFVLGGTQTATPIYLTSVISAPINSVDGTLGAWKQTTNFTTGRVSMGIAVFGGYVYLSGGYNVDVGTTVSKELQYAPINANGTLGNWTLENIPVARNAGTAEFYKGRLYLLGGDSTGDVQVSASQTVPRLATYSKLVDLGSVTTLTDITYTGSLPGGKNAISYRIAGSDGIFGALTSSTVLGGTCATGAAGRYVLVYTILDDSASTVFVDSDGTKSSLQDLTMSYSNNGTPPDKRLRAGKYFKLEVLQPLDTTKALAGLGGC